MKTLLFAPPSILLLLGVAGATEWSIGASAMKETDALLARGRTRQAIVAARRAAEAEVPGSPYPQLGYARLEALATAAEAEGKPEDAAFAWRAVREAAGATRPGCVGRGEVARADEGLRRTGQSSRSASREEPR
jgi:hypothetical protein